MARLLLALIFIALLSFTASAESIWLEAERFIASHDVGGVTIYVTGCSGASQGLAVEGFDFPGEWIELKLDVLENTSFVDSLRSGGVFEVESDLRCTIFGAGPAGENVISEFHTFGYGIG